MRNANLSHNDFTSWDLSQLRGNTQLTNSILHDATLTAQSPEAFLQMADSSIQGATIHNVSLAQLQSTESFQQKDLTGVVLINDARYPLEDLVLSGFKLSFKFCDITLLQRNQSIKVLTGIS